MRYEGLPSWRRSPFWLFANDSSVVQIPRDRHGHAVSWLQAFRDFKAAPALVLGLPGWANQPLGHPVPMEQKNLVHAVAIIHRLLRQKNRLFRLRAGKGGLQEKSRF